MPRKIPTMRATPPAAPSRANTASLDQHTAAGAPTRVDDSNRVGDEAAGGHHLPKLLQQVRTNEDRILSHRQHPISRCCDHREDPSQAQGDGVNAHHAR